MPSKEKRVRYSYVLYSDGPQIQIARFRDWKRACEFAKDKLYEGRPAKVRLDSVPASLASRYGLLI